MSVRTIFLSSTARDLEQYRKAVFEAIEALDGYHCIRMEAFGRSARAESPLEYCNARATECDVFVILVGHCWGSTPDGDRSYTEYEYDSADPHNRLVFVAADDFTLPASLIEADRARDKQRAFRERAKSGHIASFFRHPHELATKVVLSLRNSKPKTAPLPRPESSPNLGRLAAKTCDRREQERQFRENFLRSLKRFPESPQIYLYPAPKDNAITASSSAFFIASDSALVTWRGKAPAEAVGVLELTDSSGRVGEDSMVRGTDPVVEAIVYDNRRARDINLAVYVASEEKPAPTPPPVIGRQGHRHPTRKGRAQTRPASGPVQSQRGRCKRTPADHAGCSTAAAAKDCFEQCGCVVPAPACQSQRSPNLRASGPECPESEVSRRRCEVDTRLYFSRWTERPAVSLRSLIRRLSVRRF